MIANSYSQYIKHSCILRVDALEPRSWVRTWSLLLTLTLSGLGLVLKYRKGIPPLGEDTLLQTFVEGTLTLSTNIVIV
jgi:hypothetical protein